MDGVDYFKGTPECFSTLPQSRFSGYWEVGVEHSIFYDDSRRAGSKPEPVGTPLILSTKADDFVRKTIRVGENRLYRIEFVGARSERMGYYGFSLEPTRGGVGAEEILTLREAEFSKQ